MKKNKNEIIDYLNMCENCYFAVLDSNNKLETKFTRVKRVFEDIIILGVKDRDIKYLNSSANNNISVVIWNKIEGYQLKGSKISKDEEGKYYCEISEFMNSLNDNSIDKSNLRLILCSINDIYNITPGKFAGELVECLEQNKGGY